MREAEARHAEWLREITPAPTFHGTGHRALGSPRPPRSPLSRRLTLDNVHLSSVRIGVGELPRRRWFRGASGSVDARYRATESPGSTSDRKLRQHPARLRIRHGRLSGVVRQPALPPLEGAARGTPDRGVVPTSTTTSRHTRYALDSPPRPMRKAHPGW